MTDNKKLETCIELLNTVAKALCEDTQQEEIKMTIQPFNEEPFIQDPLVGKYCIVRTYSAGVFAGTYVGRVSAEKILLKDCRRLWRWHTKNNGISLSEVAQHGIEHSDSKICCVEPLKIISDIEISPASEAAKETILSAKEYIA